MTNGVAESMTGGITEPTRADALLAYVRTEYGPNLTNRAVHAANAGKRNGETSETLAQLARSAVGSMRVVLALAGLLREAIEQRGSLSALCVSADCDHVADAGVRCRCCVDALAAV